MPTISDVTLFVNFRSETGGLLFEGAEVDPHVGVCVFEVFKGPLCKTARFFEVFSEIWVAICN